MKIGRYPVLALAVALGMVGAWAPAARATGGAKIGVVDLQRCLNETKVGKKYKADFTAEADQLKAKLEKEEAALKTLRDDLEKQGAVLSETARAEKERSYREKLDAFKEKFQGSQQSLQRRDQELTRKILKDLQGVIRDIGEAGGYAIVLEKGEGGILYIPAAADLTNEVIRRYDKTAGE